MKTMTNRHIELALTRHGVEFTVTADGRILAHAQYVGADGLMSERHDLTGYTLTEFAAWLGY
jgi:hypothetical protein